MTQHPNDRKLIVRTTDMFITETELRKTLDFGQLVELLRHRKTTGELCICFGDGGIRRIWLREKTVPDTEEQSDQLRAILNLRDDSY